MIVRKGRKEDLESALELVKELAVYENALHEVKNTVKEMEKDGFGADPVFDFFVAENDTGIIGISLYYYRYSTWKGKILYIEDLIVSEKYRRSGAGSLLMDASIEEAKKQNCNGVQWQVLDWNEPAIKFYEKYKPVQDPEWINFRIEKEQLEDYKSSS
jgi:ribosomal protein S18 acetylase RimI-like enzyme